MKGRIKKVSWCLILIICILMMNAYEHLSVSAADTESGSVVASQAIRHVHGDESSFCYNDVFFICKGELLTGRDEKGKPVYTCLKCGKTWLQEDAYCHGISVENRLVCTTDILGNLYIVRSVMGDDIILSAGLENRSIYMDEYDLSWGASGTGSEIIVPSASGGTYTVTLNYHDYLRESWYSASLSYTVTGREEKEVEKEQVHKEEGGEENPEEEKEEGGEENDEPEEKDKEQKKAFIKKETIEERSPENKEEPPGDEDGDEEQETGGDDTSEENSGKGTVSADSVSDNSVSRNMPEKKMPAKETKINEIRRTLSEPETVAEEGSPSMTGEAETDEETNAETEPEEEEASVSVNEVAVAETYSGGTGEKPGKTQTGVSRSKPGISKAARAGVATAGGIGSVLAIYAGFVYLMAMAEVDSIRPDGSKKRLCKLSIRSEKGKAFMIRLDKAVQERCETDRIRLKLPLLFALCYKDHTIIVQSRGKLQEKRIGREIYVNI